MCRALWVVTFLGAVVFPRGVTAEIVFENSRVRAVLGHDAVWRSLGDKATEEEYCAASQQVCFANARVAGRTHRAGAATLDEGRLTVSFDNCDTQLVYAVSTSDDWITFQIADVLGTRPTHVSLLMLGVTITDYVPTDADAAAARGVD